MTNRQVAAIAGVILLGLQLIGAAIYGRSFDGNALTLAKEILDWLEGKE